MGVFSEVFRAVPKITDLTSLAAFILALMFFYFFTRKFPENVVISFLNKCFWLTVVIVGVKSVIELNAALPSNSPDIRFLDSSVSLSGQYKGEIGSDKLDTSLIQPGEYYLNISYDYVCTLNSIESSRSYDLGKIDMDERNKTVFTLPKLGKVQISKTGLRTEIKTKYSLINNYNIAFSKYE